MERKIGEIFEYNGEWYQCVEQPEKYDKTVCNLCDFHGIGNCELDRCSGTYRSDKKDVVFKKLEKVGEPYMTGNKLIQRYKIYPTTCCINVYGWYYQNLDVKSWTIDIEIKQTKEDMEEKNNGNTPLNVLTDKYVNGDICYDDFEKEVKALYLCKEGIKSTLKEFDLEAAKAGKPVCTRDGRKARIICFDLKNDEYPIVAAVGNDSFENLFSYTTNGEIADGIESDKDLMMLTEKKEGWVNVYNSLGVITFSHNPYDTKEEALEELKSATGRAYCVDTIKINWEE